MPFRPSIHGWPFDNLTARDASELGLAAAPASELGLGGGLCWSALDRYLNGIGIPADTPAPRPGDPLYAELVRRQVAALSGVWSKVRQWQGLDDTGWSTPLPGFGGDLASRTRSEWRAVKRSLQANRPILLTVLGEADRYTRGRSAWQVLTTGWTSEEGRVRLTVYDPSRPGDDQVQLSFAVRGALDAKMTGGARLRGFFVVPYDREPAMVIRAETFGDRAVIGLNRRISGRVAPIGEGGRTEAVARDADGALIHFQREKAHWVGANVTERLELGRHELHSDPVAVRSMKRLHVFARSYVGDLLHFRSGRSWTVDNRTDHKKTGPRFRLAGAPVATCGPGGRIAVVGRDADGGLVHYSTQPLRGWSAEQVPGEPITGDPQAVWIGRTLHVVAVSRAERLVAWERSPDGDWVCHDLGKGREKGPSFRTVGRPAVVARDESLHVFGRDPNGRLIHFGRTGDGRWSASVRGTGATGDPAATTGPGGVHAFAAAGDNGLLHAWGSDDWHQEDVLETRPSLAAGSGWSGRLGAWGSDSTLRVFTRQGPHLVLLGWRRDCDWTAAPLAWWAGVESRHLIADDPVVFTGPDGQPHLFGTDGRGTVIHLEPGEWTEPKRPAEPWESQGAVRQDSGGVGERSTLTEEADTVAGDASSDHAEQEVAVYDDFEHEVIGASTDHFGHEDFGVTGDPLEHEVIHPEGLSELEEEPAGLQQNDWAWDDPPGQEEAEGMEAMELPVSGGAMELDLGGELELESAEGVEQFAHPGAASGSADESMDAEDPLDSEPMWDEELTAWDAREEPSVEAEVPPDEPVAEEPVAEEPVAEEAVAEEAVAEEPVVVAQEQPAEEEPEHDAEPLPLLADPVEEPEPVEARAVADEPVAEVAEPELEEAEDAPGEPPLIVLDDDGTPEPQAVAEEPVAEEPEPGEWEPVFQEPVAAEPEPEPDEWEPVFQESIAAEPEPEPEPDEWEPAFQEAEEAEPVTASAPADGLEPDDQDDPDHQDVDDLPYLDFDDEPEPAPPSPSVARADRPGVNGNGTGEANGNGGTAFPWDNVPASQERPERNGRTRTPKPKFEPMDLSLLDSWPPDPKLRGGKREDRDEEE